MKIKPLLSAFFLLLLTFTSCLDEEIDFLADPIDKYLGNWKCIEKGDVFGDIGPFDVQVVRNPESTTEVLIKNFNLQGNGESARAIIAGNTITIPTQYICNGTIRINGSGSFQNGEFVINYKTNDGADEENINARYYK
jgi:hypothetical protein